jgi:hypothetical protein
VFARKLVDKMLAPGLQFMTGSVDQSQSLNIEDIQVFYKWTWKGTMNHQCAISSKKQ